MARPKHAKRLNTQVKLYYPSGNFMAWIEPSFGRDLLEAGAVAPHQIDGKFAGYIIPSNPVIRSGQAIPYHSLGKETHPHIVQGGLTRTETQPNPKPGILTWGHLGEKKSTHR